MTPQTSIQMAMLVLAAATTSAAHSQPLDFYASQDIPIENGGIIGDYTDTLTADNQYEGITEDVIQINQQHHHVKYNSLEHKWTIPVSGGNSDLAWAFYIQGHHTSAGDSDHFAFAWSADDITYHHMLHVTKTADDDTYQMYRFYVPLSGTIYVRVMDTSSAGNPKYTDTIYVDHMYIQNYVDDVGPIISTPLADSVTDPGCAQLAPEVIGGTLSSRELHAMAYDSVADRTILFSGDGDVPSTNDTWTYDYSTNAWEYADPTITGGTLYHRVGHTMVYDSSADRTILFGGNGGGHYENGEWIYSWRMNDTWSYDHGTNTWTCEDPTIIDGPLEPRWHHAMAYDPVAKLTVLVGGATDYSWETADTWVYDHDANTWSNKTATMQVVGGEFVPVSGHYLVYCPDAGGIVMYGGWTPDGRTSDTWVYDCDSNTWYNMTPDMTVIGGTLTPRARHAMVYDPVIGKILMFSGQPEDAPNLDETWTYDYLTNTWEKIEPSIAGGTLYPREEYAMVYDSAHSAAILFGGFKSTSPPFLGDTWMFTHEPAAVIRWSTDEVSDSLVRFGTSAPPTMEVSNGTMSKSHSVILRELLPYPAVYSYELESTDLWGNTTVDDNGGAYYTFTIGAPEPPNNPPDAPTNPIPADGATDVSVDVNLSVSVADPDGDDMDVSFYDEWEALIGVDYGVPSGSTAVVPWQGLDGGTTYGWYATAADAEAVTQSETWYFTTTMGSPGAMFVSDISWMLKQAGPNTFLTHKITVRYDSDEDGIAELTDALVNGATVYSTLTHVTTQENWGFVGVTIDGVVEFTQKVTATGQYEAHVTDVIHGVYMYESEMDMDNPDVYTVP